LADIVKHATPHPSECHRNGSGSDPHLGHPVLYYTTPRPRSRNPCRSAPFSPSAASDQWFLGEYRNHAGQCDCHSDFALLIGQKIAIHHAHRPVDDRVRDANARLCFAHSAAGS
jgi:hypothetical protein